MADKPPSALLHVSPRPRAEPGRFGAAPWLVSLAAHGIVALAVGGWVIAQSSGPAPGAFAETRDPWMEEVDGPPPEAFEKSDEVPPEPDTESLMEEASAGGDTGDSGGGEAGALLDGILALPLSALASSAPRFTVDPSALVASTRDIGSAAGFGSGGGSGAGTGKGGKKRNLFGLDVQTTNQGIWVFLDDSGSMQEIAARVQAEVMESFPEAQVVKIKGGLFANHRTLNRLRRERGEQDYYVQYYSSMMDQSILVLVEQLLAGRSTMPESIYVLSDFADYVDENAVDDFKQLLLKNRIKFYAHSVGKAPHEQLIQACKKTGGQVLVKPVVLPAATVQQPKE